METFPELKDAGASCTSWICAHPTDGHLVETFNRSKAIEAHFKGWTVKTAYQHLVDLNS